MVHRSEELGDLAKVHEEIESRLSPNYLGFPARLTVSEGDAPHHNEIRKIPLLGYSPGHIRDLSLTPSHIAGRTLPPRRR
jgi:hypothetical protein